MNDSFTAFYKATARHTFAASRRAAGNHAVAEDAAHEAYAVMLAKWSERQHYVPHANQRYVIGIAAHKVLDWYRRYDRLEPLLDDNDAQVDSTFEHLADFQLLYREVRQVLESRPTVSRTIGILFFLEDFTAKEVAEALGMPQSTVRTHVHRLRQRLRPLIERLGWLSESRCRNA